MKIASTVFVTALVLSTACNKGETPLEAQPPEGTAAVPNKAGVDWDDPNKASDLDWPMEGAQALPVVGASAFGRSDTQGQGAQVIWKKLGTYSDSFLRHWRQPLQSGDAPQPAEVVDAFNELALAVTGPAGFWRKTVPDNWFGCAELGDSAPCKKMQELDKELSQWDEVQKQIDTLDPDRAPQFLARNEQRIMLYIDTYVPAEPSADAMRTTGFYKKKLADVMDTKGAGGAGASDDDL